MSYNQQLIKNNFNKKFPEIPFEVWDEFLKICEYKKCKNKEIIIPAGTTTRKTFYIISGVVRGYSINKNGEELNLFLRPDGTFTIPFDQLLEKTPTKYTFESILQAEILLFDLDDFEALCNRLPVLYNMYLWALKSAIVIVTGRVEAMIEKTPEERYQQLLSNYPIFFQKAFNKHIANFLGITPVSLSRIIKRMKNRTTETA